MQYIKEFTNMSLVRVAQETLETRAHPLCIGKYPTLASSLDSLPLAMPASPPDGSSPPYPHFHSSSSASLSLALVTALC